MNIIAAYLGFTKCAGWLDMPRLLLNSATSGTNSLLNSKLSPTVVGGGIGAIGGSLAGAGLAKLLKKKSKWGALGGAVLGGAAGTGLGMDLSNVLKSQAGASAKLKETQQTLVKEYQDNKASGKTTNEALEAVRNKNQSGLVQTPEKIKEFDQLIRDGSYSIFGPSYWHAVTKDENGNFHTNNLGQSTLSSLRENAVNGRGDLQNIEAARALWLWPTLSPYSSFNFTNKLDPSIVARGYDYARTNPPTKPPPDIPWLSQTPRDRWSFGKLTNMEGWSNLWREATIGAPMREHIVVKTPDGKKLTNNYADIYRSQINESARLGNPTAIALMEEWPKYTWLLNSPLFPHLRRTPDKEVVEYANDYMEDKWRR